tara:strand:+ start:4368 stop:4718 length:351 start_codon:yes stop_codon:yes gene_type:complete
MATEYKLKKDPIDANRVKKDIKLIIKSVTEEAKEDRKMALDAYDYFKAIADDNPQDSTAKGLMVDCLKLAQSSKVSKIKMLDLLIKIDVAKAKPVGKKDKEPENLYEELDSLANEK